MNETPSIRRLVQGGVVIVTGGIGRGAVGTTVEAALSEGRRSIGGNGRQCAQARGSRMDPVVHSFGGFGGRHHTDVMMFARRVDGVASLRIHCTTFLGLGSARHYTPFK
eukprot:102241-Pleurochrysis_carterae.AAC.1